MRKKDVVFQVADEPQIETFTQEGEEIIDKNNSEMDSFFDFWTRINMNPKTLFRGTKQTDLDQQREHLAKYTKSIMDLKCEVVVMKSILDAITNDRARETIGVQGTMFTEKENLNPDLPLGAAIVDKQLQLQQACSFLSNSAKELAKSVAASRNKYRKINKIAQQYPIDFYFDKLKGKFIPVIPSYPSSFQSIVLDLNGESEDEKVKWKVSNNLYFNYNGKSFYNDLDNEYGFCNSRIILQLLFDKMKRNLLKENDDYRVSLSSKSFVMNFGDGEDNEISITDEKIDNNTVCPLFLPYLLKYVYQPFSTPYSDLKLILKKKITMNKVKEIVFNKFMKQSFCTILTNVSIDKLVIQINGIGNSIALLSYNQDKLILTNPSNQLLFITINTNSDNFEKQLKKWCDDQFWRLFTQAVIYTTKEFGFSSKIEGKNIKIYCSGKRRTIFSYYSSNEIGVCIKEDKSKIRILWANIPITNYFQKLEYLFFYKFKF